MDNLPHPDRIWFISDTHFGHKNILKYTDRAAETVEQMDQLMIKGWNDVVGSDDLVYHLGDFGFCGVTRADDILAQLKGRKRLVYGNHDRGFLKKEKFTRHWEWIRPYHSFRHEGTRVNLFHFPIAAWDEQGKGAIHLHGHSHGSYKAEGRILDVGIDGPLHQWSPVNLSTIFRLLMHRAIHVADGHHNHEANDV